MLVTTLLVVATLSAVVAVGGAAALRLTGRQIAVVLSGSMTPQFVAGDAVIVKPAPPAEDLKVGQVITFHPPGDEQLVTHRIHALIERPEGLFVQTKGDANPAPDPNYTPAGNVVGIAETVIPGAGRYIILYTDAYWRLLTLGVPLLIVLIYHAGVAIRTMYREDDEDDENEDDATDDSGGMTSEQDPAQPGDPAEDEVHTLDLPPARADRPVFVPSLRPGSRPTPRPDRHPVARPSAARGGARRMVTIVLATVTVLGLSVSMSGALYASGATVTAGAFTTAKNFCGSSTYAAAVAADRPTLSWPHGSASADSTGTYSGSVTMPVSGAMACSDATTFTTTGALTQSARVRFGSTFTVETWFKSAHGAAAQIVGFGDRTASQGDSTNRERVLYVDSAGRAAYAYNKGASALTSPASIVDGTWHYLVVTYRRNAATLYVDGKAVASVSGKKARNLGRDYGYWRAGTDTVAGLPGVSSSGGLTATLDETAIYDTELTSAQIANHWAASGR
jgi:signal peptidase I